jgi:hypothetical protein
VHRYYQEQYQLDGGKQNRYVTGSDAVGLTRAYYDTRALPIYKYLHTPATRATRSPTTSSRRRSAARSSTTSGWSRRRRRRGPARQRRRPNDCTPVDDDNGMPTTTTACRSTTRPLYTRRGTTVRTAR